MEAARQAPQDTVHTRPCYTYREGRMRAHKERPHCGLTPVIIDALKAAGHNQNDIARMYGISPQRVSQIKFEWGRYSQTPRERAREAFPFKVETGHQRTSPDKRLRDHAEYAVTGGKGMKSYKLSRLRSFYDRLIEEDLVVAYDRLMPPSPGIKYGGYSFEERNEDDEDFVVRFNGDVELTEEQRNLWRFPPDLPKA